MTSTYQRYDQEYNFPEANPLSEPPKAIELIPEADPKQRRRRRGRPSGQTLEARIPLTLEARIPLTLEARIPLTLEARTPPTASEYITR